MTTAEFIDRAKALAYDDLCEQAHEINKRLDNTGKPIVERKPDEINFVWFSKTLTNYKLILAETMWHNLWEITYNDVSKLMFVDRYKKERNRTVIV